MKAADIVIALDGLLMIAMGVLGFLGLTTGHHSVISLIAGGGIGVLLLATIPLYRTKPRLARIGAAVIALLPLGQFGREFMKAPALYPSGIICLAGLFTFAFLLGAHFYGTARRKSAGA